MANELDLEMLAVNGRISWIADRLTMERVHPRHIGRPVEFSIEGGRVVGVLDSIAPGELQVSGEWYLLKDIVTHVKVYRRVVDGNANNKSEGDN